MAAFRYLSRKLFNNSINSFHTLKFNGQHRCVSMYQYDDADGKDPGPVFFNERIQELLRTLTRPDLSKIYTKRKLGSKRLSLPIYKFLTEDQLKAAYKEAEESAREMIQMPPVLRRRRPIDSVLHEEPALQGLESSRLVFTDITYGVNNAHRMILVREPDGVLRKAEWDVRDRMNQIYFPIQGRELRMPAMFEEEYLKPLLQKREYVFVLDRACLQFEPDDAEYHRVTHLTYVHINEHDAFDALRSTRHFGPFAFFLAWFKLADNLLLELLSTGHLNEAIALVRLYSDVHSVKIDGDGDKIVEGYIEQHSIKRGSLELALQGLRALEKERKELQEGLKAAHGNS